MLKNIITADWNGYKVNLGQIYVDPKLHAFKNEYLGDTFDGAAQKPDMSTYYNPEGLPEKPEKPEVLANIPDCPKGYIRMGTRIKDGKRVPHCIPEVDEMKEACWKGYKQIGMKEKDGRQVPNCVPVDENETDEFCPQCLAKEIIKASMKPLEEAEYQGRTVNLGKPFRTPDGPKKFSVYVKNKKDNVVKVNFGDPNMRIKKNITGRRKNFRARHRCATAKDRTKARYWSCRAW